MLSILGQRPAAYCDGHSRRHFLKIGGLAMGGLALPQVLKGQTAMESVGTTARSHKAVIMIYLSGGPSHQDMYDLKMSAGRDSWLVPPHFHQRPRHRNLRAHAASRQDDGQVYRHSLALRQSRPA